MQRGMNSVWERMIGAAALNPNSYDAVKRDARSTTTAMVIVLATSACAGVGAFFTAGFSDFLWIVSLNLAVWAAYACVTYVIGATVFRPSGFVTKFGELARPLAFAQVPAFLMIASGSLLFGSVLGILVFLWILADTVIAVRQSFDLRTGSAAGLAITAWLLILPLRYIILMLR